jgi:hypothetical protein
MTRRYAEGTKVPVKRSRDELERVLERYGAEAFAYATETNGTVTVAFQIHQRLVRIVVPGGAHEAETRQRWRALVLVTKARLEAVESGIESVEEAFLANVVMPDGRTVAAHTRPAIAQAYETGGTPALLSGGER